MRIFLKYLLILLTIIFFLSYYLFNTSSGNKKFNSYLSKYLSAKTHKEVVISDINFTNYPNIDITTQVNKKVFKLTGHISFGYSEGIRIKGDSTEFGGRLYFDYDIIDKSILFTLKKISLEKILTTFSYPVRMTADLFGTITYDMKSKVVTFDNQLKKTRLIKNKMTNVVFLATKIDITKYLYDKSSFKGYYYDFLLVGDLKIDSGKEHLYFKELRVNSKTKKIDSTFHIKMEDEELSGKVSGTTKKPRFRINFSKLIKDQVYKNMVEVDEFSKKAKTLFNNFFN